MANFSYSTSRNPDLSPSSVTAATSAPGAGDVEVRIKDDNGITKEEVKLALERIWMFYTSSILTTSSNI